MSERLSATPALIGMAAGLALFYWGDALPLAPLPQLLGLAIFVELAFLRADLALLAVPFTAPLYLIPAALPGLRAEPLRLPLHEAALLATAAAVAARWAWDRRARSRERGAESDSASPTSAARPGALRFDLRRYLPHALFLLATLPPHVDANALLKRALAQNVAFVPGAEFHLDGHGGNTMRLNFSNATPEKIEEAVKRLGRLLAVTAHCGSTASLAGRQCNQHHQRVEVHGRTNLTQ